MTRAAAAALLFAVIPALGSAQVIDQKLDNGFTVSPQRSPQIYDFTTAVKMREQASGDPAFNAKLDAYKACTEASLKNLAKHDIQPLGAWVYTSVRQCTRTLHDYVLMFGSDSRFQANQYVGHAIMRLTQQDQIFFLTPMAAKM